MKNRTIRHWTVLIAGVSFFHFASPLAWAGLDYYLVITNYTDDLTVTASWDSGGSDCINAVQNMPPIPPNPPNGNSTELTISTDGSGSCAFSQFYGADVVEDLTVTNSAGNVIATASIRIPVTTADTSPHCVDYEILSWSNPGAELSITQPEITTYGYCTAHILVNICDAGDPNCNNSAFVTNNTCGGAETSHGLENPPHKHKEPKAHRQLKARPRGRE